METARQWNIANNSLYIKALQNDTLSAEIEMLTLVQQLNEYVMTSLRTLEGTNLEIINDRFGQFYADQMLQKRSKISSEWKNDKQ